MRSKVDLMLNVLFTCVYFIVCFVFVDRTIGQLGITAFVSIFAIVFLFIGFIVSVALADYTVKKIKRYYKAR